MALKTARFVSLFLAAMVAGAVFTHVLQTGPWAALSGADFLVVQRVLLSNYGTALGFLEVGALLAVLAQLLVLRKGGSVLGLTLLAAACLGAVIAVWALFLDPLNDRIFTWTPDDLPADWQAYRDWWAYFQLVRLVFAGAALGSLILAALMDTPRRRSVI